MMPRSRSRGRRLSRSAEFERVYRQGRSVSNRHLVLYSFPNQSIDRPRLGLSVSRKVGGAVERNQVKRLLREAFEGVEAKLSAGQDIVVVARPEARDLAEREGLAGIETALGDLLARAGLRTAVGGVDNNGTDGLDKSKGLHPTTDGQPATHGCPTTHGQSADDGESTTDGHPATHGHPTTDEQSTTHGHPTNHDGRSADDGEPATDVDARGPARADGSIDDAPEEASGRVEL